MEENQIEKDSLPGGIKDEHQEKEATTRDKIMEAAKEVFAEKGYHGTSMKDIAKKAEVNKASLFYHFSSKENLYRTLIQEVHQTFTLDLGDAVKECVDIKEKIYITLKYYIKHLSLNRKTVKIILREIFGVGLGLEISFTELIRKGKTPLLAVLEEGKRKGVLRDVDLDFVSTGLIGMMQIFFRIPMHTDREYQEEEILNNCWDFIRNGIFIRSETI